MMKYHLLSLNILLSNRNKLKIKLALYPVESYIGNICRKNILERIKTLPDTNKSVKEVSPLSILY